MPVIITYMYTVHVHVNATAVLFQLRHEELTNNYPSLPNLVNVRAAA